MLNQSNSLGSAQQNMCFIIYLLDKLISKELLNIEICFCAIEYTQIEINPLNIS